MTTAVYVSVQLASRAHLTASLQDDSNPPLSHLGVYPQYPVIVIACNCPPLQVDWVNGYHTECRKKVGAFLTSQGKAEVVQWLEKQTQPLSPALNK